LSHKISSTGYDSRIDVEKINSSNSGTVSRTSDEFCEELRPHRWVDSRLAACGSPELSPGRVAVVSWLIGKVLILPGRHFLVHECDYATSALLLKVPTTLFGLPSLLSVLVKRGHRNSSPGTNSLCSSSTRRSRRLKRALTHAFSNTFRARPACTLKERPCCRAAATRARFVSWRLVFRWCFTSYGNGYALFVRGNQGSGVSAQSVAFLCVQRFENDPQNNGEIPKLKLLQMIFRRYPITPR